MTTLRAFEPREAGQPLTRRLIGESLAALDAEGADMALVRRAIAGRRRREQLSLLRAFLGALNNLPDVAERRPRG